jgi:hypothetical protein
MTLAEQAAADWAYIDSTETVTLRHTSTGGTTTNTAGVTALPFKLDKLPDGTMVADHKLWVLRASTLGSVVPVQGDMVVNSDSEVFVIENLSLQAWDTTWNCITRKEVS